MLTFFWALVRFLRALIHLAKDEELRGGLTLLAVSLLLGATFYHNVEGWSFFDSFYFCVTTLATVGFGDFAPQTMFGKIFTIIYIFTGIGLLLGIVNAAATVPSRRRNDTGT